jgi:hypothetical protein
MKYLKKFEVFVESNSPATLPKPDVKPAPTKDPSTKPTRRDRPSPIRRDRPAIEPDPQAKLKKAKVEDVVENFLTISKEEGFNYKKYFPKA